MHVHLGSYEDGKRGLAAYLQEGITGVRDCGSPLDDILRLRRETENGTTLGPHMVVAGPIIQGPLPFQMPVFISARNTEQARSAVRMLKSRGVDFIKVQDAIPYAIYVAVATEANLDGIPFAGHIPPTVLPEEASEFGQHSIEHLGGRFSGVLIGCSTHEAELHREEVQMYYDVLSALEKKKAPPILNMRANFTRTLVETYDPGKAAALISRFRRDKVWQCPTLVALHTLWNNKDLNYTVEDLHWADRLLRKEAQLVALMQAAGIGLLAGTDLAPDASNGTIHDELAALVQAGLTPLQALQAATRSPAQFLHRSDVLGTIEKGKTADLLILNANPLEDIRATSRIYRVILRGHIIPTAPVSIAR